MYLYLRNEIFILYVFFQNFYVQFVKKLKTVGKGETNHRPPAANSSIQSINELAMLLQEIMECKDKNTDEYRELIKKLPEGYQNCYHVLVLKVVIYIVLILFARRAKERLDTLTKAHYVKKYDDEEDYYFWAKVRGERSKKQQ